MYYFYSNMVLHSYGIKFWAWAPSSGDGQYKTLFLYCVDTYGDNGRNNGPFWEPGVFQMYINIAVLFLLYSKKKYKCKIFISFRYSISYNVFYYWLYMLCISFDNLLLR